MTTILQKFKDYADKVGYSFVLLTPDDVGSSKDAIQPDRDFLKPRARQNVILELGYFMGKLGLDRVCCISKGEVEPPSDMGGVLFLKFQDSVLEKDYDIVKKLTQAGYKLDL